MSASIDRNGKLATLSESFHHNLSLYALAASAAGVQLIALTQPSEAEVIYTPAHTFIGQNRHFSFDLNHDGVNDFTILNHYAAGSSFTSARLEVTPDRGGGIECDGNNVIFAAVFQKGQTIGFSMPLARQNAKMEQIYFLYGTGHFSSGYWGNDNNGYLGLAFRIDGQIHFGWARLDVQTTGAHLTRIQTLLTGYAYETQPDTPIIAGDTGGVDADKEGEAGSANETPQVQEVRPPASLGVLSLGAPGLTLWRNTDF